MAQDGRKYLRQKYSNGNLKEEKKYTYYDLGQIESTIEYIYDKNNKLQMRLLPNGQKAVK